MNKPKASFTRLPRHLGLIMDGNGRWAKGFGLSRLQGHKRGRKTLQLIGEEAQRLGIDYLTVYAFSAENWLRPKDEVSGLMALLEQSLRREIDKFAERQVRVRFIGDFSKVPDQTRAIMEEAEAKTKMYDRFNLTLAIGYGGRQEITRAVQQLAEKVKTGDLQPKDITMEDVQAHLHTHDLPDMDLIIRTSGEQRLSNFMPWQSVYSEIAFVSKTWPEFRADDLHKVLQDFQQTERRYGKVSEQL